MLRLLPLLILASALAGVRLPSLFSDGMVLQRERPCRVWGKAEPGEDVSVRFRSQTAATKADNLGRWFVTLAPMDAGGPFELKVDGKNSITIGNVLVGEVWIGSGQSNMVWQVQQSNNRDQEIAAANFPRMRYLKVPLTVSQVPVDDVKAAWVEVTPQSVATLGAAGYFFSRHLHEKLNVPIGFIQTAWGGTPAESWISPSGLAADPALISVYADWAETIENYPTAFARYEQQLKAWEKSGTGNKPNPPPTPPNHSHQPSGLYNSMIAPLVPYAMRGVIWYQGENNASKGRSYVYRKLFAALIQDWRRVWGQGDFPFLWVQLANYSNTGARGQWPELREAQSMALALRNTGQAVTIDIGESKDIHPKNKQDVGLRLALAARAIAYGEQIEYSGPVFRQAVNEGATLRAHFEHTGTGMLAKGDALRGFEIAGADMKFSPAEARIEGASIVLAAAGVGSPLHVRYGWGDDPGCNLYNNEGLPASPFRSEDWAEPRRYR